jgi:hypothetical protein
MAVLEDPLFQARMVQLASALNRAGCSIVHVLMVEKAEEMHKELCRFFFMSWFYWKLEYMQEDAAYTRISAKITQSYTGASEALFSEKLGKVARCGLSLQPNAVPFNIDDDKEKYSNHNSPRHRAFFSLVHRAAGLGGPNPLGVVLMKLLKCAATNCSMDIPSIVVSGVFEAEGDLMFGMEQSSHVTSSKATRCAVKCQPLKTGGIEFLEIGDIGASDDTGHSGCAIITDDNLSIGEAMKMIDEVVRSGAPYGWQTINEDKTTSCAEAFTIGPVSLLFDRSVLFSRDSVAMLQTTGSRAPVVDALNEVTSAALSMWRATSNDVDVWKCYVPCFFTTVSIFFPGLVGDELVTAARLSQQDRGLGMYSKGMLRGSFRDHRRS